MKKHIAAIASLCLFYAGYAQEFESVTEFKYKNNPYGESIDKYECPDGFVLQYSESSRGGMEANANLIYVSNAGVPVPVFEQKGKAFSRPDYFKVGDVNAGKLVLYDPNASKVILQIRDLSTANTNGTLMPDFSAISTYEKIKRPGLDCQTASLSWRHSYEVQSIFADHLVLQITSVKKQHYINPAIINFNQPNVLEAISPELPAPEAGKSSTHSAWNYEGSSADRHFYFRGYTEKKKGMGLSPCTNSVAVVDNNSTVVNTFTIDMTMPGLKIMDYNQTGSSEGKNVNLVDYKVGQCIYMLAMGEDAQGKMNLVVKKVDFDGKLIWGKNHRVVKYGEFKEHFTKGSVSIRYDYDNTPVLHVYDYDYAIDPNTGDLKAEMDMSSHKNDHYPLLDKNIKAKCESIKRVTKDAVKVNFVKRTGNTCFVLFECKNDMAKLYKFKVD